MSGGEQVVVRHGRPDDLPRLLELVAEFCEYEGYPRPEEHTRRGLEPLLGENPRGHVLVPTLGTSDEPAGYAVLTWGWGLESGGLEGLLDEIYVSDRGHGVGTVLLEAVIADARAQGCVTLFLETEASNERQRGFYQRHGLEPQDSIWMSMPL